MSSPCHIISTNTPPIHTTNYHSNIIKPIKWNQQINLKSLKIKYQRPLNAKFEVDK
jgi:hypothetical protein